MTHKIVLTVYLLSMLLLVGCQEKQKSASLINELKQEQKEEIAASLAVTCANCNLMSLEVLPRDIEIARHPGINDEVLYLTAVDKKGQPIKCCNEPMRIVVRNNGKLALWCPDCGKYKPVAVEGDKVIVE